mmetsp:Transcript_24225/g.38064  ORF Transcript_24225/g.38064 Transcript_24225/m.38064 type:complete len:295 (+) Transcript_24225:194-1078(+)
MAMVDQPLRLRGGMVLDKLKGMLGGASGGSDGLDKDGYYTLVLVRHGESQWNKENRFTGWVDVPLAESGVEEAHRAGKNLAEEGLTFDVMYTSLLQRAITTGNTILGDMGLLWIPVEKTWRLNERHYGALQGLNKKETVDKHGIDQVTVWRRSYDTPPPTMDKDNEYWPGNEARYASLSESELPATECLKDTVERVLPWWNEVCAPAIKSGKRVLIAAHGNSLRALVKYLDGISDGDITGLNIPTAIPLVYKLDKNLKPVKVEGAYPPLSGRYACDPEIVKAAIEGVAAQTAKK